MSRVTSCIIIITFQVSAQQIASLIPDKVDGEIKVRIHEDPLKCILSQHEEVSKLLVVAIVGKARLGKSFIMNLFAIYLKHLMVSSKSRNRGIIIVVRQQDARATKI